jgi:hypothetical protein
MDLFSAEIPQGAKWHQALLSFREKLQKTQSNILQLSDLHVESQKLTGSKKVEEIALLYLGLL